MDEREGACGASTISEWLVQGGIVIADLAYGKDGTPWEASNTNLWL